MSILSFKNTEIRRFSVGEKLKKGDQTLNAENLERSQYQPDEESKAVISKLLRDYNIGYMNYNTPRREFNDVSLPVRTERDKMEFNNYLTNDGQYAMGDLLQSWRSNAQRPIGRDKIIATCAYATAKLMYPKIWAFDQDDDIVMEAAQAMEDINERVQEKLGFEYKSLVTTLTALWSPASIVYTGYEEKKQLIKTVKTKGVWQMKEIVAEDSGIQSYNVPVEEFYIANYYESTIQGQDFVIWRRTPSYDSLIHKYRQYENWKYVRPGIQTVFAQNLGIFYYLYDPNLTNELCEEIVYWNKSMDVMLIMVNGVLLTDSDNPNPRIDKKYPFAKMGYEIVDEGKFFYYKSLASKIYQDAKIVNTLYQLVIDGSYLSVMPPQVVTGQDTIGSDVIIPGAVTTLSNPNATITAIRASQDIGSGLRALQTVEGSLQESVRESLPSGMTGHRLTATELQIRSRQSSDILGLFIKMIVKFTKDYGELSLANIVQYAAVPLNGRYQAFQIPSKNGSKPKKIQFAKELLTPMSEVDIQDLSAHIWQEEQDKGVELLKVNPMRFKELRYEVFINPDMERPMSEEATRALKLEIYQAGIQNPYIDPIPLTKKFLLGAYPHTIENVDTFIKKDATLPNGAPTNPLAANTGAPPLNTNDLSNKMAGANPGGPQPASRSLPALQNK